MGITLSHHPTTIRALRLLRVRRASPVTGVVAAVVLSLQFVAPALAGEVEIITVAQCDDLLPQVEIRWAIDDPGGFPEWTGFDVYRTEAQDCSGRVLVNDEPRPRFPGTISSIATLDKLVLRDTYHYEVFFVNDAREPLDIPWFGSNEDWIGCPSDEVPVTVGTVEDLDGEFGVSQCLGRCYADAFFASGYPPELESLAGTGEMIEFFGDVQCGTTRCWLHIDTYAVTGCEPISVGDSDVGSVGSAPFRVNAAPVPYRGGTLRVRLEAWFGSGVARVTMTLVAADGRRVRTIADGIVLAGTRYLTWDGTDEAGRPVGSGVYYLRASQGGWEETLEITVLR